MDNYKHKYFKYKQKYLNLYRKIYGGLYQPTGYNSHNNTSLPSDVGRPGTPYTRPGASYSRPRTSNDYLIPSRTGPSRTGPSPTRRSNDRPLGSSNGRPGSSNDYLRPFQTGPSPTRQSNNSPLGSSNGRPGSLYGRPGSSNGRPGSSNGRPGSSYGRPGSSYGRPGSSYGRPGSSYGHPGSSYGYSGSSNDHLRSSPAGPSLARRSNYQPTEKTYDDIANNSREEVKSLFSRSPAIHQGSLRRYDYDITIPGNIDDIYNDDYKKGSLRRYLVPGATDQRYDCDIIILGNRNDIYNGVGNRKINLTRSPDRCMDSQVDFWILEHILYYQDDYQDDFQDDFQATISYIKIRIIPTHLTVSNLSIYRIKVSLHIILYKIDEYDGIITEKGTFDEILVSETNIPNVESFFYVDEYYLKHTDKTELYDDITNKRISDSVDKPTISLDLSNPDKSIIRIVKGIQSEGKNVKNIINDLINKKKCPLCDTDEIFCKILKEYNTRKCFICQRDDRDIYISQCGHIYCDSCHNNRTNFINRKIKPSVICMDHNTQILPCHLCRSNTKYIYNPEFRNVCILCSQLKDGTSITCCDCCGTMCFDCYQINIKYRIRL